MSTAEERTAPLRIRGTPRRLSAILPGSRAAGLAAVEIALPTAAKLEGAARKAASPAVTSFPAFVRETGELRLDLPRDTPPGVYDGVVRLGDHEQPVTVEVEPVVRLRLFPTSLAISAGPGETVGADLTLINDGNAPADIRAGYAFWLLNEDGVHRVLGRLFETSGKAERKDKRLERVLDAVEEQYGGNARVKIRKGAGKAAPGSRRELHVDFFLPARLQPGQTYEGMWHLYDLQWQLRVTVTGETTQHEETPL